MENEDVFGLLSLISSYGKLSFRKRLQKIVYIGKNDPKIKYPFSFEFVRYHYGPFSFDLKNLMDTLIVGGFIKEDLEHSTYSYHLTERGTNFLQELKKEIGQEKIKKIEFTWKTYGDKSVSELTSRAKEIFGW